MSITIPSTIQLHNRLLNIINTQLIVPPPNTIKYNGSCHCKQIQYILYITQSEHQVLQCNCSICTKKQYLHLMVDQNRFQLTHGTVADFQTYTFNTHQAIHLSCNICGIHCIYIAKSHPGSIDCNLYCIDDIDINRFNIVPFDGINYQTALDKLNHHTADTINNTSNNTLFQSIDPSVQFNYNLIVVRELCDTFVSALCMTQPDQQINLQLAKQQHNNYIQLLQSITPRDTVYTITGDNMYPDGNFIEDTVTVVNNIIFYARMAADTRHGEQSAIKSYLSTRLTNNSIVNELSDTATLDGGDILFTGTHLYIGISKRTNIHAYQQIKSILQSYQSSVIVQSIDVIAGLHLKSVVSVMDYDTLVVCGNECGRYIQQQIELHTSIYKFIVVSDIESSNVLRIYNYLIIQDRFPHSSSRLYDAAELRKLTVHKLDMSELIKADGALTCGSVLIHI